MLFLVLRAWITKSSDPMCSNLFQFQGPALDPQAVLSWHLQCMGMSNEAQLRCARGTFMNLSVPTSVLQGPGHVAAFVHKESLARN